MAQKENVIIDKSYTFALRIVNLYKFLTTEKKEYVLSKQVLRSGTAIGANAEEAVGSQSRKEFRAKMSIVHKEARETRFWLNLLRDASYLDQTLADSLLADCDELLRISGKIFATTTNSIKSN